MIAFVEENKQIALPDFLFDTKCVNIADAEWVFASVTCFNSCDCSPVPDCLCKNAILINFVVKFDEVQEGEGMGEGNLKHW